MGGDDALRERRGFLRGLLSGILLAMGILVAVIAVLLISDYQGLSKVFRVAILVKTQALTPPATADMVQGATRGLVESMKDPYSSYLDKEEVRQLGEFISGSYGGLGVIIAKDDDEKIVVVSPFRGTPAYREGLQSGDIILRVDGKETQGMMLEEAAQLMQGQPGTKVKLDVKSPSGTLERAITLVREEIHVPSVSGSMIKGYPGVGYIEISTFNDNTANELGKVLEDLKDNGLKSLVLDLRNNPGGQLNAAVDTASYLIPPGPVVYIMERSSSQPLMSSGEPLGLPMVALVNEGTASAAEILVGALMDTGMATVIGEKTFGKGLVQKVFQVDSEEALKLTTAKYLTPKKRDINKKGIDPDITVAMTAQQEREALMKAPAPEIDIQLQRALDEIGRLTGR